MTFKNLLLLLCFSFLFISGYSQAGNFERTIQWDMQKTKQEYSSDGQLIKTIFYLNFRNAEYIDYESFLPYYTEIIKLEKGTNAKIDLINMKFESVPNADLQNIKHLDKLSSEISVSQSVQYERLIPFINFSFIPLKRNPVTLEVERLLSFTIQITMLSNQKVLKSGKKYISSSVLATGNWYKIRVQKDTIYKLAKGDLLSMGITDPANARIYGNGGTTLSEVPGAPRFDDLVEIPTMKLNGPDGNFSYLLFYAAGPLKWHYNTSRNYFYHTINPYSDYSYYYVTSNSETGKQPISTASLTASPNNTVNTFDDYAYHELNNINILSSGKVWLGEKFDVELTQDFLFSFQNIVANSTAKIACQVVAQSTNSSSFSVKLNNQALSSLNLAPSSPGTAGADEATSSFGVFAFQNNATNLTVELSYNQNSNPNAVGYLDYLDLNIRKNLIYSSGALKYRDINSVGTGNISNFNISNANKNLIVWDITDIHNVKQISTVLSGNTLIYNASTDTLHEFVAFDYTANYPSPEYSGSGLGVVENQNLHGLSNIEMVIVTFPDFLDDATSLANIHSSQDNMKVKVVTTTQVYNEFSSGTPEASAIRDFMKMLYDNAAASSGILPKYLLLFGDGSFDNKTQSNSNTNFIPTYQSASSFNQSSSFVSDDYYGLLDNNENLDAGMLDIGVGRLPVDTKDQASFLVEKINIYRDLKNRGNWQNNLCFIADEWTDAGNSFAQDADNLAKYVNLYYPYFNITKIYIGAYPAFKTVSGFRYPDVNAAINAEVNNGALILNYTGHGSQSGLSNGQIITIPSIMSWNNLTKPTILFTATCEFSRYDDFRRISAGEYTLFNTNGGSVALFSTTRIVYQSDNFSLNINFNMNAFRRNQDSTKYRLGDIMLFTKNGTNTGTHKRNFSLLGDPALQLNYPDQYVITDSINGVNPSQPKDTLKALSKVNVKGHLEDVYGNRLNQYNGVVTPSVYDKEATIYTLNNMGLGVFQFAIQNSILFKGLAKVVNGKFSYSFIVPKDINYSFGPGKISYFGINNADDAKGSYKNFIVGGTSNSALFKDKTGPKIHLLLNDKSFVSGGTTNENPILFATLEDSAGINTVGSGIGHDITAVIDNNVSNPVVLNEYYVADTNSYQKGSIKYPLTGLTNGKHNLSLKVWDVVDNSSTEAIDFIVAESANLALDHVLNYPNPFTTHTSFYFEQNQPMSDLDILIQVFTVSGKLVKSIETKITAAPTRIGADPKIDWDGRDDFGDRIGRGVYIYRVKVSANGKTAEKFQKLVILK